MKLMLLILWNCIMSGAVMGQSTFMFCRTCRSDSRDCNFESDIPVFSCNDGTDQCYVRNLNGILERGCLQNITSNADRDICFNDNDSTCLLCPEMVCNNKIWPSCHVCRENEDSLCRGEKSGPGTFCTKYTAQNSCFERIVNGTVERGCSSDLGQNPCENNEQCRVCTTSTNCNGSPVREFQVTKCVQCRADDDSDADGTCLGGTKDATICAGISDGICYSRIVEGGILERGCHGNLTMGEATGCNGTMCELYPDYSNSRIFPVDRLRCNQCSSGCNETLIDTTKSTICKHYLVDNKCYSRITSNHTFERGCLSDIINSNCTADDNCIECSGNNCNTISEQTLLNYPKCLRCSSDEDNCIEGTAPATKCDNPEDSCFVRLNGGILERNCLSVLNPTEQSKCTALDDDSCTVCTARGCNNQIWPTCHICNAVSNSSCPLEQLQPGSFCTNYNKQANCFEQFVEGSVQRGCVSDLNPAIDPCTSNGKCKSCSGKDCNNDASEQFQNVACLQCIADGTDIDGSCLLGGQDPRSCEDRSNAGCYVMINDGFLERGCQSDISNISSCNGTSCKICSEEGCNRGIFPENRLQCYECSDCDKEATLNTSSAVCRIFNSDNKCYSRITQGGVFERGCQYDLQNGSNPCTGLENCILCSGNKCNSISETQMKKHQKCLRCTSRDQSCSDGLSNATSCDQSDDICFTRVKDGLLERNCLSTLSDPEAANCTNTEDQSCQICSVNGCNNPVWTKCHQCSGTHCNEEQSSSESKFCPKANLDRCFERLEAGNVTRDCTNDLLGDPCKDSLECKICNDDSCNGNPQETLVTDQRCLQCNTTVDPDGSCLEGRLKETPCRTESGKQCFSRIDDDGVLQRGCRVDLSPDEIAECSAGHNCTICIGTGCNGVIFPGDRLQCHQCNSLEDQSCSNQLTENSAFCKIYAANDSCYTRILDDKLYRGCQSDLESSACNILNKKHCQTCSENNCNGISQTKLKNAAVKLDETTCIIMAFIWLTINVFKVK